MSREKKDAFLFFAIFIGIACPPVGMLGLIVFFAHNLWREIATGGQKMACNESQPKEAS
jgi:hypothetical protein